MPGAAYFMQEPFNHIDLCSGIGTFAESVSRYIDNSRTVVFCETNPYCKGQLQYSFPGVPIEPDVKNFNPGVYTSLYNNIHLLTAGFPCQDISISQNTPKGLDGKRSGLYHDIFNIITQIRPRYILLENSPMLVRRGLHTILSGLTAERYFLQWRTIRAEQFGYPHRRKRIFIAAVDNSYGFGFDTVQFFNNLIEQNFQETKREAYGRLARKFGRLFSYGVQPESYAKFLRLDNGYSHKENAAALHAIGNAIVPECIDVFTKSINTFHKIYGV